MRKDELIQNIRAIFRDADMEKIILFGSWARGREDAHSDVDLIVVEKTNQRFLDRLARLYEMWSLPLAVDILAYTPDEFRQLTLEENPFLEEALRDGEVIYERPA